MPECRKFQNVLKEHDPKPPLGKRPYGPWSVTVAYFNRVSCLLQNLGSLRKHDVDGSENVIWKCNFSFLQSFLLIIQSHYACKLCSNYPGIKLKPALMENFFLSSTQWYTWEISFKSCSFSLFCGKQWQLYLKSLWKSRIFEGSEKGLPFTHNREL